MRNLSLDQIQTLVVIADLGSFAAASRALHLAPPTISLHVSELEARFGARLLDRGPRRVQPTPAGAALVERGRALLKAADEAAEQVRRIALGQEGKVRLGASTGVIVHLLPHVLTVLAQRSPGVDVELSIVGSADTLSRLQAGTLEIGIVALPQPAQPGLALTPWRSDPMMAFLPLAWDAPERVTPGWLAERPMVANDASTFMHRLTMEWFAQAGFHPRARIELNYTEAMKSLVIAGYGAAVLPLERLDDARLHEKMQLRPLDPPLLRHVGIAHRASVPGPATQAVLQVLSQFAAFEDAPRPESRARAVNNRVSANHLLDP